MTSVAPARTLPAAGEPLPPAAGAPRGNRSWRSRLHAAEARTAPYAYVAPFFAIFLAFGLFPLIYTAYISLHRYRLGSRMSWVGLDNYLWLFGNPGFYNALWKTITIGVLSTVPQLALALGLAHLLNYRLRGRTFLRVAMLMPYATSVAAATLVFALIFGRDAGLVNGLLGVVRIDPVDWRNGNWTAQVTISVIVIWRWTGYNALIYLAGMQAISSDLYEAAAMDGAQRPVHQPQGGVEQLGEDHRRCRQAGRVRHQDRDPEEGPAAKLVVEQVRDPERHAQLGDGRDDPDRDRVAEGVPEEVVGEQVPVVLQPDPVRLVVGRQPGVVERHPGRGDPRVDAERREDQEERQDIGVADAPSG